MANNAQDVQHLINVMAAFSLQCLWGLVVNTDKTEVMIFKKAGRLYQFKFVYLGIVSVRSGIFTPTQSRQAQKTSSTLYMIKKGLLRNRDFSI